VSAQSKSISEVVKDFEQSLQNLRPSTKRVYVAGARAAIRAASLEPIFCRSIGIDRKIPRRKERTNLAIPGFFSRRRAETIGIRFGLGGFAKLGDSNDRQTDALREKSLHRKPARHGLDRRDMCRT
jgi:hypothetical protein